MWLSQGCPYSHDARRYNWLGSLRKTLHELKDHHSHVLVLVQAFLQNGGALQHLHNFVMGTAHKHVILVKPGFHFKLCMFKLATERMEYKKDTTQCLLNVSRPKWNSRGEECGIVGKSWFHVQQTSKLKYWVRSI